MKTKRVVAVEEEKKRQEKEKRLEKAKGNKTKSISKLQKTLHKFFTEREAFHSSTLSLSL
jgi:uncharacterized protein with gpF-like domain